ncbi:PREDICTED: cation channel sperm-associated protein 2-like isoform X2 [Priapulus caudatus]|uniref:Cation channel sperm-associated protein 2-like isoform X2 n=1 Tax=Priapulus caudatus TaxID=37621 RepID=A0ABM1E5V8_PRICU|nr:PREDICTED: cation channel sperm-associated protein 2-like isoform X2 [Priapulus caudatus]
MPKKDTATSVELGILSKRAEMFRSKLIEDFHLLDSLDDHGKMEGPKHYSRDITDKLARKIMKDSPHGLVKFQVYSSRDKDSVTHNDRRKNRVKNKNARFPPIDLWAHWVLNSTWFKNSMLIIILSNSIALGIQAEVSTSDNPVVAPLQLALDIFDYCSLIIFILEIKLKWLDNFWGFWGNGWNIFDFCVTYFSFVPEIMSYSSGTFGQPGSSGLAVVANNMRVFRILRSLKMVTRFRQIRLIALAITKAFKEMVFITLLLFTFAYIFAIAGIIFFDDFTNSKRTDLIYKDSFSTLPKALATLFQLFTLDHWYAIRADMVKVVSPWFTGAYIILWICIGSFIFRNIFVGIMVNNFQSIRNELFEEVTEFENTRQLQIKTAMFNAELTKQGDSTPGGSSSASKVNSQSNEQGKDTAEHGANETDTGGKTRERASIPGAEPNIGPVKSGLFKPDIQRQISQHIVKDTDSSAHWDTLVQENIDTISRNPSETLWPRDTLFKYLQLMEALQDNLEERMRLEKIICEILLQVHDT